MERPWTHAGLLLLGLGLGAALGFATRPTAAPPPAPVGERPVVLGEPLPVACGDRRERLEAEADRLEAELETVRARQRVIDARRLEREGAPVPWPDDADPNQDPERLRTQMDALMADLGGTVVDTECEEYPCLIAVTLPNPDPERGVPFSVMEDLKAALQDHGYEGYALPSYLMGGKDDQLQGVFSVGAEDDESLSAKRIGYRADELHKGLFRPEAK